MSKTVSFINLLLIGIAGAGGMMGGSCVAFHRIIKHREARVAILVGYAVIGMTFGVASVALGHYVDVLNVPNERAALIAGLVFGSLGSALMAAANLGSVITLRYLGFRVTIENDKHDSEEHR